ncbi:MAG: acyl-CoA dehydrogenase family protein, partial [Roseovarius sp.]|nr:acyl-CoA dehydrogenase family protein [Roseovarius sp.]
HEHGGGGAGLFDLCIVIEELAKACTASALMPVMTNILGVMLLNNGTESQKARYLRPLAEGRITFSNAITEPGAGSDISAMTSKAVKTDGGYLINGTKCYITGAGISDFYIAFAKLTGGPGQPGISAFIVPRDVDGVALGKTERKMGIRGMPSSEVVFSDCYVPDNALLGPEGGGMKVILDSMTRNRPAIGARCVGLAQGALDVALAHCKTRKAFGGRLMDLQALQFKLADMAMEIEASRQLVHRGAALIDDGADPKALVGFLAMGKCLAADTAMRVSTEAVQLMGAYGYSQEFPLERLMRDAKHLQIVDGSNEIQRVLIARALDG